MPHAIAYVKKAEWNQWLETFKETFALKLLQTKQGSESDTARIICELMHLIQSEKETVFEMAASAVANYCGLYGVSPKEKLLDEFKHIYFLGTAVACFLRSKGEKEWARMQLLVVQDLLDFRLMYPLNAQRPKLTHRIIKTIEQDKVQENLGSIGWYLIYKCLFNAALEKPLNSPATCEVL